MKKAIRKKSWGVVAALVFVLLALFAIQCFSVNNDVTQVVKEEGSVVPLESLDFDKSTSQKEGPYKVSKVVDGDTLDIIIDGKTERVRLIGINTPEVVDPRKTVECFGKEASDKAKETLSGKSVYIESDSSQGDKDKYGRLLRYVFIDEDIIFNKMMIEGGFAYEYTYEVPYKYQEEFKRAQKDAELNKRGLWADGACK